MRNEESGLGDQAVSGISTVHDQDAGIMLEAGVSIRISAAAAAVLLALVLAPGDAAAEWFAAAYLGSAHTAANTLRLSDAAATALTVGPVDYHGNSWIFPLYYGYRGGWSPAGSRLRFEAEWTHAKAIGDTGSADLPHFELSHGLNTLLGNVAIRSDARWCRGRCAIVGRVGFGITTPHVEAEFRGRRVNEYQFGGVAAQGGGGVEIRLWRGMTLVGDGRVSYARVEADLPGVHLEPTGFTTVHADIGLGWSFARR
jgi:hypothetical protein